MPGEDGVELAIRLCLEVLRVDLGTGIFAGVSFLSLAVLAAYGQVFLIFRVIILMDCNGSLAKRSAWNGRLHALWL